MNVAIPGVFFAQVTAAAWLLLTPLALSATAGLSLLCWLRCVDRRALGTRGAVRWAVILQPAAVPVLGRREPIALRSVWLPAERPARAPPTFRSGRNTLNGRGAPGGVVDQSRS